MKVLVCQIIGRAAAGSAGPVLRPCMQYNDKNEHKKGFKTLHLLIKHNVVQMTFRASQSHIWAVQASYHNCP